MENIADDVARFRARGVQIEKVPELDTVADVADIGFALAAWFTDPHRTRSASSSSG
jgi:hypothetical protein